MFPVDGRVGEELARQVESSVSQDTSLVARYALRDSLSGFFRENPENTSNKRPATEIDIESVSQKFQCEVKGLTA